MMVWMAHGMKQAVQPCEGRRGPCPSCELLSLSRSLSESLMTTAQEENLLRSEAELKLDLVSRFSLH
jgi:hypothetical protein